MRVDDVADETPPKTSHEFMTTYSRYEENSHPTKGPSKPVVPKPMRKSFETMSRDTGVPAMIFDAYTS